MAEYPRTPDRDSLNIRVLILLTSFHSVATVPTYSLISSEFTNDICCYEMKKALVYVWIWEFGALKFKTRCHFPLVVPTEELTLSYCRLVGTYKPVIYCTGVAIRGLVYQK